MTSGRPADLSFVILNDYNGKLVRNAAVVLHLVNDKGKQERGGIELKTDSDGKANYETIPYGKLRVQVLMTGFQTYGADYDINQAAMEITIRIKRPEGQYSTYRAGWGREEAGRKEIKSANGFGRMLADLTTANDLWTIY